jgi:hypothetical protein
MPSPRPLNGRQLHLYGNFKEAVPVCACDKHVGGIFGLPDVFCM